MVLFTFGLKDFSTLGPKTNQSINFLQLVTRYLRGMTKT